VKGACKNIVCDLFLMIEGRAEDELPERVRLRLRAIYPAQMPLVARADELRSRADNWGNALHKTRLEQLQVCSAASTEMKHRLGYQTLVETTDSRAYLGHTWPTASTAENSQQLNFITSTACNLVCNLGWWSRIHYGKRNVCRGRWLREEGK
jgi:hypothetical protein